MVKHSCFIHLAVTCRTSARPPHNMVTVAPAGAGEKCDVCKLQGKDKPATWAVNPYE